MGGNIKKLLVLIFFAASGIALAIGSADRKLETNTMRFLESGSANYVDVTSPSLSGDHTLTLPAASDTLVGKATTDVLANKSIGGALTFNGSSTGTFSLSAPATASGAFVWPADDGDADQVLSTNGAGALSWITSGGSSNSYSTASKTATYTLTSSDQVVFANASAGAFTISFPAVASVDTGKWYILSREDNEIANVVTLDPDGVEQIGGGTTSSLNTIGESVLVVNTGTAWSVIARNISSHTQAYTPATAWDDAGSATGSWRRKGKFMAGKIQFTGTGASINTTFTADLPTGATIDTTDQIFINSGSTPSRVLSGARIRDAGNTIYQAEVTYSDTNTISLTVGNAGGTYLFGASFTKTVPFTFGSSDVVEIDFEVPMSGWQEI